MPARSRSQQRLFGMVRAYNEGEFRGSGALRRRIAELARRVSKDDAEHFARTPHEGLPEKRAQAMFTPEELQRIYGRVPMGMALAALAPDDRQERSGRRRSFLGSVLRGGAAGTVVGGLGAGALGAFLAHKAAKGVADLPADEVSARIREAALRTGLWGATRGAAAGAVVGGGLNLLGRARE